MRTWVKGTHITDMQGHGIGIHPWVHMQGIRSRHTPIRYMHTITAWQGRHTHTPCRITGYMHCMGYIMGLWVGYMAGHGVGSMGSLWGYMTLHGCKVI